MQQLRETLSALFIVTSLLGSVRADRPTRPRASWEDRDAFVLVFSPDGRTLLTSGQVGARLRDAETGRVRVALTTAPYQIHGPLFSPDNRLLFAKVNSDRYKPVGVFDLKVWDVETGETHATIPYIAEGINASTEHFALSHGGKTLAFLDHSERLPTQVKTGKMVLDGRHEFEVAYNVNPGLPRVKIWDVRGWKETAVLDGGSHMVFSPDGTTLVTGSRDWKTPVAKVWDVATGKLLAELAGQAPWVKPMTFSPDGKFLAIGGTDDQTLWELASGKKWMVPVKLLGNQGPVFSPDGGLLFPNGLPRGYPAHNMNQEFPCYDVSVLPPRRRELGEGQLVVQPLTYNEPRLLISTAAMRYVAFSEADRQGDRSAVLHDLHDGRELARFPVVGLVDGEFSPDGRWLALSAGWAGPNPAEPKRRHPPRLHLLDPDTGRLHVTVPTPDLMWGDPQWTFSPDSRSLAVSYVKGTASDPDISERPRTVDLWDVPPR